MTHRPRRILMTVDAVGGVWRYAVDLGALAQPTTSGVFSTPANGSAYTYSTGFPDSTSTHNYWVDVTFTPNP